MICHRAHLAADDHPTVPALRSLDVEEAVANELLGSSAMDDEERIDDT